MEVSLRPNRIRSGYEPSDTENEHELDNNGSAYDQRRSRSPLPTSTPSPARRRHSKSPYRPRTNTDLPRLSVFQRRHTDCPFSQSERRTNNPHGNGSPFSASERRRYASPLKDDASLGRKERSSSYSRRAASAPRSRLRPRGKEMNLDDQKLPSVGEINERVANANMMSNGGANLDSMDSIFFSRAANQPSVLPQPPGRSSASANNQNANWSSLMSRQSSNISDTSGRTSGSTARFVASRRKNQSETTWFLCIKKGSCKTSNKSPEKERPFDEASFITKAVVVESLRPLWADKHQPLSLTGFACHKNEAQLLLKLANSEMFPHILFKGPPGTGKKALTLALLRELYGDPVWNESRPMQVVVPVSSSPHHVELNVYTESKAAYALTALVKQISSEYAVVPEISVAPNKAHYKVLVLYDVDKAAENIQHLIKWIMDCYSDCCKLILCCEDDTDVLESVKSRCKLINIEPSTTHQVMEVLIQIAKKEGFELSTSFASKIANKSKQNLRRAIMALEACKLHNYPFADDQHIPVGWEEAVVELAADILADPSPKRLLTVRGKIQKILADFVHPKLILLKLVEQVLRGVDASLKREIYYWYAYYDKRLPSGASALLKLEEFVAKFMSIYRKSSSNRH
ncbi:replication factor C subunit 3-like [Salvia divinorum]|uniref:Replication factor C subunit 3-like n=1 Tax=Salvia divinorum TaxID=28513 RepID=A0ABD1G9Q0_SALDI